MLRREEGGGTKARLLEMVQEEHSSVETLPPHGLEIGLTTAKSFFPTRRAARLFTLTLATHLEPRRLRSISNFHILRSL